MQEQLSACCCALPSGPCLPLLVLPYQALVQVNKAKLETSFQ